MPYFHLFPIVLSEQYGEGEISRVSYFFMHNIFFHYSANTDIYTSSTIYIPDIYTSERLDTALGGKGHMYVHVACIAVIGVNIGAILFFYIPDIYTPASWDTGCIYIRVGTV